MISVILRHLCKQALPVIDVPLVDKNYPPEVWQRERQRRLLMIDFWEATGLVKKVFSGRGDFDERHQIFNERKCVAIKKKKPDRNKSNSYFWQAWELELLSSDKTAREISDLTGRSLSAVMSKLQAAPAGVKGDE